jgi:S-DNA-T family DNA segregation ATPase FtsK/SpoIIIE
MTYSLNTLTDAARPPPSAPARACPLRPRNRAGARRRGAGVLAAGAGQLLRPDAAFSTSGTAARRVRNWGGRLGAWLADGSYFLLGYSVWWCLAAGVRAWLASLARWMRGGEDPPRTRALPLAATAASPSGSALAVLLCASTALEWSRLYRFEAAPAGPRRRRAGLPGRPGRREVAGLHRLRPGVHRADGAGAALVFRFSWSHVAERIGARIDGFIESRREKREIAEDLALGQRPPASARRSCRKSASRSRNTIPRRC